MHPEFADTLERCYRIIRDAQENARLRGIRDRPRWPAIVLRTPKGWTGPKVVDGVQIEGTFRAHQVPLANVRENAEHLRMLETWMRSYRPEDLFDPNGRLKTEIADLAPKGHRRMGANPHANGTAAAVPLAMPDFTHYAVNVEQPGSTEVESTRPLGALLRDIFKTNKQQQNFRLFCPDPIASATFSRSRTAAW